MLKSKVIKHFGGTQKHVAIALGITEAAVSQWGFLVPQSTAYRIESMTNRVLQVNPKLYAKAAAAKAAADKTSEDATEHAGRAEPSAG